MKKIIAAAVLGLSILATAGCATDNTTNAHSADYNEQSMLLNLGMDKNTVMQILGTPRRTDVNSDRERWIYWHPAMYGYMRMDNEQMAKDRLVVTFVNGKVSKWGQQTAMDDALEGTNKMAHAYATAQKPQP